MEINTNVMRSYRKLLACMWTFLIPGITTMAQSPIVNPADRYVGLEILPPSPHSASLGKFGGIQPGLNAGTMKKEIPLLTFRSGKLSVPISVSYSSNGIKVDEIASRVGLSWNLNAGGVITRTVFGEVDEEAHRITDIPDFSVHNRAYIDFMKNLVTMDGLSKYWDGEPDLFSFNFCGHYGQFVLDANMTPVELSHTGLKIVRSGTNGFTITDLQGVHYVFGMTGGFETIRKSTVGFECGREYPVDVYSAYYLTQIIPPLGETITFKYTGALYEYEQGIVQNLLVVDRTAIPVPCNGDPSTYFPSNSNISCTTVYRTTTPLLSSIESASSGKVTFDYVDRTDVGDKLLKNIKAFRPGETTPYKIVSMDYLQQGRPFLTGILIKDGQNVLGEHYQFSYQSVGLLPSRLSFSQDYYGYANGKNNLNFYPKPPELSLQTLMPEARADREPNFPYTQAGMLSRIIYPTGGSDSIVYESNTIWGTEKIPAQQAEISAEARGTENYTNGMTTSSQIEIQQSQEIKLNMYCVFEDPNGLIGGQDLGKVELISLTGNSVVFSRTVEIGQDLQEVVYLSSGVYFLRVTAGESPAVRCAASFLYASGVSQTISKNKTSAGVRVAKIIFESNLGVTIGVKKYNYSIPSQPEKSSGVGMVDPIFHNYISVFRPCPEGYDRGYAQEFKAYTCASNAVHALFLFSGVPVSYSYVTEEDEGNNGGVEYHFTVATDISPHILLGEFQAGPMTSQAYRNGLELSRYIFKKSGNTKVPVQKIFTSYQEDTRVSSEVTAYVARYRYLLQYDVQMDPMEEREFDPFDFMSYSHPIRWIYPDTVRTQIYNADGTSYTETIQVTAYDNPTHAQPTRKSMIKSDGGSEVDYISYADDYPSGTAFINDMKTNHITGLPIEQIRWKETGSTKTILSGVLLRYQTGGKGLIDRVDQLEMATPVASSAFKFSNRAQGTVPPSGTSTAFSPDSRYKELVTYNSYDTWGNLLQITPAGGSPTSYIWSYKAQYPVAEIKNASYSTVVGVLGGATAVSNFVGSIPSDASLKSFLAPLRSNASLQGASVTTNTYDTAWGVTTTTDPSGRTAYFKYDSFGRMETLQNTKQKPVEQYQYHYRNN